MKKENEMMPLGEAVRTTQKEPEMIDLVYNEKTGQFEQMPFGSEITEGVIVTSMVDKGFA